MSVSRALLQRRVRPDQLAGVLAVNTALIIPAVPLGTIVGGPLVVLLGARGALLACAVRHDSAGLGGRRLLRLDEPGK
jgi:DHA3 family macrolide efflux protein-like MFS transporter